MKHGGGAASGPTRKHCCIMRAGLRGPLIVPWRLEAGKQNVNCFHSMVKEDKAACQLVPMVKMTPAGHYTVKNKTQQP